MFAADAPFSFTSDEQTSNVASSAVLTEQNFTRICYWLNQLSGRELKDYEKLMAQSRLSYCATLAGCQTVNQYVESLLEIACDFNHIAWRTFTDSLLSSENWFRREARLYQFLRQIVFPEMPSDVRILSAGCGTGEEAYDLGFECSEYFGSFGKWHVDAIDLSGEAIAQARQGQFVLEHCRLLPEKYVRHYLSDDTDGLRVNGAVKDKISFKEQNLLHLNKDVSYKVIFCRNVLMDMDKISARRLVENLSSVLDKSGYLIVSHNESLEPYFAKEQCLTPYIVKMS